MNYIFLFAFLLFIKTVLNIGISHTYDYNPEPINEEELGILDLPY